MSWFYLIDQPEGFDFAARFEVPGETNVAWTWRCRPGEHTEGNLTLVACSNDGGRSWNQLPKPPVANLDHGTARGSVVDERGDAVAISSGLGCDSE
jgi:hypothetical protein